MSAFSIFTPRRLARLASSDARSVGRDPMLLLATAFSVLPPILLWAFRARIDEAALAGLGVEGFARYLVPTTLLLAAALIGWVAGFLMLEDRDDGPLLAVDVTPAGKLGFLTYRLTAAAAVAGAITLAAMPVLVPEAGLARILLVTALVAAATAAAAAILPAVARNKVEGLALTKLVNLMTVAPLLALIPSPLRYLAGIVPTYWLGELLLPLAEPLPVAVTIGLAIATHIGALAVIAWLLGRRVG